MNKKELIKHFEDMPYVSISQMGKKSFINMIEKLDEPQKVTVPQFVADWIKTAKTVYSLSGGMTYGGPGVNKWLENENNQRTFVLAWFDGYEVEKEKRYTVKLKNTNDYLNETEVGFHFYDNCRDNGKFTQKEIEEAGFGEVFNSPLFEIEEVE